MGFGILIFCLATASAYGQFPILTNFYGGHTATTTYNGVPVPVGSLIEAFDEEENFLADWIVGTPGLYGFLAVTDESGLVAGDPILFYVNGRSATPTGPDDATFGEENGERKEVNLLAMATLGINLVLAPSGKSAAPGDIVHYSVIVENTGDGIDFYSLHVESSNGWTLQYSTDFVYADPGENVTLSFILQVPPGEFSATDQIEYTITSGIDETVSVEGNLITFVSPTDIGDNDEVLPTGFRLYQNYPNPFNPSTTLAFDLPASSVVTLDIYNLLGRKVKEFNLGQMPAGHHDFIFDAGALSSGVYLYRLNAGDYSDIKRMVFLK